MTHGDGCRCAMPAIDATSSLEWMVSWLTVSYLRECGAAYAPRHDFRYALLRLGVRISAHRRARCRLPSGAPVRSDDPSRHARGCPSAQPGARTPPSPPANLHLRQVDTDGRPRPWHSLSGASTRISVKVRPSSGMTFSRLTGRDISAVDACLAKRNAVGDEGGMHKTTRRISEPRTIRSGSRRASQSLRLA